MNKRNFIKSIGIKLGAIWGGILSINKLGAKNIDNKSKVYSEERINKRLAEINKNLELSSTSCKNFGEKINKIAYNIIKELRPDGLLAVSKELIKT